MYQPFRTLPSLLLVLLLLSPQSLAAFSFSEYEKAEQEADSPRQSPPLSSLKCPSTLKGARIATMIGEMHRDDRRAYWGIRGIVFHSADKAWDERFGTTSPVYGSLVESLNSSFGKLGLRTYTAQEIQDQIAQAEQEAVLNDDIDAALAAAEQLQADYLLKGIISSHAQTNKVVDVDEAFLTIEMHLIDRDGREISSAAIKETVFSDADIPSTIRELVRKNSAYIAYTLFHDICSGGH